MALWLKLVGSV